MEKELRERCRNDLDIQTDIPEKKGTSFCAFCSEKLDGKPYFRVQVDENTLEPCGRYVGIRYYFCSKDCKAKWLASPKDECFVCHRAVRTDVDSAILKYVERGGLDFYICNHKTPIHREWSERIDSFLEEHEAESHDTHVTDEEELGERRPRASDPKFIPSEEEVK